MPTPAPQVEKIMYGIKDAAFALSVSKRYIEELLHDKKLTYRRMGRRVLIPASELRRISRMDTL
jgi:excisionase family DNA binding protein